MTPAERIAAVRRFAPPLLVPTRLDRRGAWLRALNSKAFDYVKRAGVSLSDVYPDGLAVVQRLAPVQGTPDAAAFLRATGLAEALVYPPSTSMSGERGPARPRGGRPWAWALAGATVGAVVVGPIGLAAGAVVGWVGGSK